MPDITFREELQDFAVELRKLAYTMPAGHEDRLVHLSERMVRRSREGWRSSDTALLAGIDPTGTTCNTGII